MKIFSVLFFVIILPYLSFAQSIEEIRLHVNEINSFHDYQTKTLDGDEFLDGAPDRGASLTGYYKSGELVKIVEWIGVSTCINITEFYYRHDIIIFISNSGKSWLYSDKKEDFDYDSSKISVQARYYFSDGHLLKFIKDSASVCHNMASEGDTSDLLKSSKRYKSLLGDCSHNYGTDKLIPIDYTDTIFDRNLAEETHDTLTRSGWKIKYFVKDDCKKADDIYIEWSKGSKKNVTRLPELLLLRPFFIPQYDGETDRFIFMAAGCEQGCAGSLYILSKSDSTYEYFHDVADYSIPLSELVYIPESDYEHEKETFEVVAVNLNTAQEKTVIFHHECPMVFDKANCVDIQFKKNKVIISGSLASKLHPNDEIEERRVVSFP